MFVLFDHHHHFFEGSVAGAFAEAIDGTFDLAGAAAMMPAMELAVARARSLWQWQEIMALSILGTLFMSKAIFSPY